MKTYKKWTMHGIFLALLLLGGVFRKIDWQILLLIIGLAGAWQLGLIRFGTPDRAKMIRETIGRYQENTKELTTLKYYYTDIGSFEHQNQFIGVKIPLTYKRFIVTHEGVIRLGVQLQKLKIQVEERRILLFLPQAELLSHELREDSIRFFDEQATIFNPMKLTDYTVFVANQKAQTEAKIVNDSLLLEARNEARRVLRDLLLALPEVREHYELEFLEQ